MEKESGFVAVMEKEPALKIEQKKFERNVRALAENSKRLLEIIPESLSVDLVQGAYTALDRDFPYLDEKLLPLAIFSGESGKNLLRAFGAREEMVRQFPDDVNANEIFEQLGVDGDEIENIVHSLEVFFEAMRGRVEIKNRLR